MQKQMDIHEKEKHKFINKNKKQKKGISKGFIALYRLPSK